MSKKGMEMSINLFVGMVLGIAMLGAGILLFSKIMTNIDDTNKQVDEQTKKMIEEALDTGDPIYVPESTIEVKKGSAVFWIGLRNINSTEEEFRIDISLQNIPGNTLNFDQSRIAFIPDYTIGAKENEIVRVAVNMKGITQKTALIIKAYEVDEFGNLNAYANPRIVTIQP